MGVGRRGVNQNLVACDVRCPRALGDAHEWGKGGYVDPRLDRTKRRRVAMRCRQGRTFDDGKPFSRPVGSCAGPGERCSWELAGRNPGQVSTARGSRGTGAAQSVVSRWLRFVGR